MTEFLIGTGCVLLGSLFLLFVFFGVKSGEVLAPEVFAYSLFIPSFDLVAKKKEPRMFWTFVFIYCILGVSLVTFGAAMYAAI